MKNICVSILLLSVSVPSFSQSTEKFDIATFRLPTGWKRSDVPGGILLESTRTRKGSTSFGLIYVYPSRTAGGSAVENFGEEWRTHLAANLGLTQPPQPHVETTTDGWTIATGAGSVSRNYVTFRCLLVAATGFGKVMSFLVTAAGQEYVTEIDSFFKSLELDTRAAGAAPPAEIPRTNAAPVVAASNHGVFYAGMEAATGGFNYGNSKRYLYLNPDNHTFRWGFCQEGYYRYDTQTDKARNPDFAGTYELAANSLTLTFYSSRRMQLTVDASGNIGLGLGQLIRCPQLNGFQLEGKYVKADVESRYWPGGRQPKAVFSRNGRFEDDGLLCMGLSEDLSLPLDEVDRRNRENRAPGKGSYTVVDNTLLLNYDDGRKRQLLMYVFGDDAKKPSPELIVVAGMPFSLVK